MPYNQYTLAGIASQLATLLDDPNELYWSRQEKYYALWEAMYIWGAYTSYWKTRGSFTASPSDPTPYYDLSVKLPTLRARTWTLGQMVADIQYMCLEAPGGILGTGMSGQISVSSILESIQRGRNRFVLDAHVPFTVTQTPYSSPPPNGLITLDGAVAYLHRAAWKDAYSGRWQNLWRQDAWAVDHANPNWAIESGLPCQFSESELSPLKVQLVPQPANVGSLETVTVNTLMVDTTNANSVFNVPDEWVHAIKYATLSDLFSAESQNTDPLRAQYAEMRYQQAIDAVQTARSVIRVLVNNMPLPLDSLAAIDAALPFWRNTASTPFLAGSLYDMVVLAPVVAATTGVSVDVVQSAPIPAASADLQMGPEEVANLVDYASHILTFKCGGSEFKQTWPQYDSFLGAISTRGQINKVKLHYLKPLLEQPLKEEAERPDIMEKQRA